MQQQKQTQPLQPPAGGSLLGTAPIWGLIRKYAVPAIISILVSAAYNITDQIFIGRLVGMYGNAATNVAMPLTTLCTATALMVGIGSASNFNLNMGAGRREKAARIVGTGLTLAALAGIAFTALALLFLEPMMRAFGATAQVLPLAMEYTGITALGLPFLLFSSACSNLIRADGSPNIAMLCTVSGALLNIGLDALFMYGFGWGIAGAAWATVVGQVLSAALTVAYLTRFKTVKLARAMLRPQPGCAADILRLGVASFLNHFVMMLVQIVMNNTLRHYGGLSAYGSDIPLAVVGVISKVNIVLLAFMVGLAQGCQPIFSFNYGARQYTRVKEAYKKAAMLALLINTVGFLCFQLFPQAIVGVFGSGSELYFEFAERYLRVYMMMVILNGIQPLSVNFFTATGKARQGIVLSLTRQGLLLLPLLVLLPMWMGIDGVLYAGPIADLMAVMVSLALVSREMKKMRALQAAVASGSE